jgi:hypothetical protein
MADAPPPIPLRPWQRYMGRVFLPPAPSQDLHVNIGLLLEGNQNFPKWMPVFEHAISEKDYDEMVGKMKALLAEKYMSEFDLSMRTLSVLFCLGIGCLFYKCKEDGIKDSLKGIAAEYGLDIIEVGNTGCRYISHKKDDVNGIGFDQHGIPLSLLSEKGSRQIPAWPPMGFNIILKGTPELDLRSSWPRSAGALAMLGFSVPSDCQVTVDDSLSIPLQISPSPSHSPSPSQSIYQSLLPRFLCILLSVSLTPSLTLTRSPCIYH